MVGIISVGGRKARMSPAQPITIVGGGLAGLSLGVALCNAGVPTRIVEAGDYPRHRVCGEFITGLSDATIEKLGIAAAFEGAASHCGVTWFLRARIVDHQTLPAAARAISRYRLDARLAELFVAAGGQLATHTRVMSPTAEPGWVLTNGRRRVEASPWIGLKMHARDFATTDDLELHLGEGAYVGLSSVEEGWTNVCGLFRRRAGLKFNREDALLSNLRASGLDDLAERLAVAEIRVDSRSAVAGFAFDRRIRREEGVRLGDACALIPPFTGNGMAMAFMSAALALDPLVAWARGDRSWPATARAIHELLAREFRLRLASAACVHPFLWDKDRQRLMGSAARFGLLPLRPLYQLLH